MNIELDEYIPQLTADAGVKVSITEPGEMPFPIYNSLSLAPGFQNEIALKRVNMTDYSIYTMYMYIYITSKVTVNSSYFHPAHQHYTDEAHKAETVPSVVRFRSMA